MQRPPMAETSSQPGVMISDPRSDYALIDSGHGRKLERYGDYRFIRPEPQAMWSPAQDDWQADGEFIPASDDEGGGRWHFNRPEPRSEEHTSELQSRPHLVCRLLLEKKN